MTKNKSAKIVRKKKSDVEHLTISIYGKLSNDKKRGLIYRCPDCRVILSDGKECNCVDTVWHQ